MSIWRLIWRVTQHEPKSFWVGGGLFVVFLLFPVSNGWLVGRAFSELEQGHTSSVFALGGALLLNEVLRMTSIHLAALYWTQAWTHMQTFLRANLLAAQLSSGGPNAGRPVDSAGEALTHFRDDVEDVAQLANSLVDMSAGLTFAIVAAFVLGSIDPSAAAVLAVPLVVVAVATRMLDRRIKEYRAADRLIAGQVGGLLGDVLSAATTIKVNAADESALARLQILVDQRRHTATRDRVLEQGTDAISEGSSDVGLGLVLLISAAAIASGQFGVGQLAVFVSYLGWLSFVPQVFGQLLARRKQAGVAFDRMRLLVANNDVANTVQDQSLPIGPNQTTVRPTPSRPARLALERMEVVGLNASFGDTAVLTDITFSIERGSFVVITGPIGSGKTTLLRAVLGLAYQATCSGDVLWNGAQVADRAAFFVPPNAAFLPQVPQLISDSIRDNIALGQTDNDLLAAALDLAEVSHDLAHMADGADTIIGPRGLRLSGGQRQRVATARALIHRPELVVLDDLSSALDVETELRLWSNLGAAGMTVLAVSHRAVAFQRADQVLYIDGGIARRPVAPTR